ncbi:MAG: hypothetical protein U1F56_10220 [Rubrivivax sp.]
MSTMAGWTLRCAALLSAALLLAAAATAAPADDFKRGELAYARGDVVGAMAALRPPAQAGHAPSQVLLAFILDRADFAEEAFGLYRDAAGQGDPEGHAGLALAYLAGRGVTKDEKLALQHFSKAADLGHEKSAQLLSDAYVKGELGLARAPGADALAAVRRAADRQHLPALDALAEAYASGRWGLTPDPAQAAQWKARAAELRKQRARPPARTPA